MCGISIEFHGDRGAVKQGNGFGSIAQIPNLIEGEFLAGIRFESELFDSFCHLGIIRKFFFSVDQVGHVLSGCHDKATVQKLFFHGQFHRVLIDRGNRKFDRYYTHVHTGAVIDILHRSRFIRNDDIITAGFRLCDPADTTDLKVIELRRCSRIKAYEITDVDLCRRRQAQFAIQSSGELKLCCCYFILTVVIVSVVRKRDNVRDPDNIREIRTVIRIFRIAQVFRDLIVSDVTINDASFF